MLHTFDLAGQGARDDVAVSVSSIRRDLVADEDAPFEDWFLIWRLWDGCHVKAAQMFLQCTTIPHLPRKEQHHHPPCLLL